MAQAPRPPGSLPPGFKQANPAALMAALGGFPHAAAPQGPQGPLPHSSLAIPVANPGSRGQNMRYYVGNLQKEDNGHYTDGVFHYDENGLSLDRPDTPVGGLPPADESERWDISRLPSMPAPGQPAGSSGGGGSSYAPPQQGLMQSLVMPQSGGNQPALQDLAAGGNPERDTLASVIHGLVGKTPNAIPPKRPYSPMQAPGQRRARRRVGNRRYAV